MPSRSSIGPSKADDPLRAFIARVEDPPDGVRLAVKDLIDTAGLETTYGSAIFRGHVPRRSASCVARLERAGYAVVGKTNLHEFAYGITSENDHYGHVVNPLDGTRIAGGSSGGSAAALAAGLCDAALGTDSGGSVRIPAACCGVVGLKPTWGLVPTDGVFPLAPSFDHVGPMARDVAGCSRMLEALVPGFHAPDPADLGALSVAVAWLDEADVLVRARVSEAVALLGAARPVEIGRPRTDNALFRREVADVHCDLFPANRELYGESVRLKVERCFETRDDQVETAARAREAFRTEVAEALGDDDLLVTPTLVCVAPPAGAGDLSTRDRLIRLTLPVNVLGWPALALPCGLAEDGLPASIQLIGRPGADAAVLAAGAALEAALHSLDRGTA